MESKKGKQIINPISRVRYAVQCSFFKKMRIFEATQIFFCFKKETERDEVVTMQIRSLNANLNCSAAKIRLAEYVTIFK